MTPFIYDGSNLQADASGLNLWGHTDTDFEVDGGIYNPVKAYRYRVMVEGYV